MGRFHAGEIEVQRRRDVQDDAERVGRIIASKIPPGLAPGLTAHRLAISASLDAHGRPWASPLTGPAGFIAAVDEDPLRLEVDGGGR